MTHFENLFTDEAEKQDFYPKAPGLIFRVCESAGTYIVRSICVDDVVMKCSQFRKISIPKITLNYA